MLSRSLADKNFNRRREEQMKIRANFPVAGLILGADWLMPKPRKPRSAIGGSIEKRIVQDRLGQRIRCRLKVLY
jgi:hypothetical protein